MPVLLSPTAALLLQATQVGHRHDFAGALGQSRVQIINFAFRFDRSPTLHNLEPKAYTGPNLPLQLEGSNTIEWAVPRDDAAWLIEQLGWKPRTVRGVVTLGSGRTIQTAPMKVSEWLSQVDFPGGTGVGLHIHARDETSGDT